MNITQRLGKKTISGWTLTRKDNLNMQITFYGAVREVTGSMHLIETGDNRILLDCGMFQGRRKETNEKNRTLPIDPATLTNVVLSHAHIDHSGRIPLLTKNNFGGRIISTRVTVDACEYLLRDSAYIQESDASYLNYKTLRSFLSERKTSGSKKNISKRKFRLEYIKFGLVIAQKSRRLPQIGKVLVRAISMNIDFGRKIL